MHFKRVLAFTALVIPTATFAAPVPEPFFGALFGGVIAGILKPLIFGDRGGGGLFSISEAASKQLGEDFPQKVQSHIQAAEDTLQQIAKIAETAGQPEVSVVISEAAANLGRWNADMSQVIQETSEGAPPKAVDENKIKEELGKAEKAVKDLEVDMKNPPKELKDKMKEVVEAFQQLVKDGQDLMTALKGVKSSLKETVGKGEKDKEDNGTPPTAVDPPVTDETDEPATEEDAAGSGEEAAPKKDTKDIKLPPPRRSFKSRF